MGYQGEPCRASRHHTTGECVASNGEQMQAERNKRATILTSEGEKQAAILQSEGEKTSRINRAEADRQQAILIAEGQAEARIHIAEAEAVAIQKITDAVGQSTNPANYLNCTEVYTDDGRTCEERKPKDGLPSI